MITKAGGATNTVFLKRSVHSATQKSRPNSKPTATGASSTIARIRSASFAIRSWKPSSPRNTKRNTTRSRPSRRRKNARALLADNLHQHALAAVPVEFVIEDVLPRAEMQLATRDGHNHFAPHYLALEVRV